MHTWRHRSPAVPATAWPRSGCSGCGTCWCGRAVSRRSSAAARCCDPPWESDGSPACGKEECAAKPMLEISRAGRVRQRDVRPDLSHQIIRLVQQRLPVLRIHSCCRHQSIRIRRFKQIGSGISRVAPLMCSGLGQRRRCWRDRRPHGRGRATEVWKLGLHLKCITPLTGMPS